MNRRRLLAAVALSVTVPGCLGGETPPDSGGSTASATDTAPETTGGTRTPSGTTDGADAGTGTTSTETGAVPGCWPSMCAGTQLLELDVSANHSGAVTLEADCREGEFRIDPGESQGIDREADGESCQVRLVVGGETAFDEQIGGYERVTLTVADDGDVSEERVVY